MQPVVPASAGPRLQILNWRAPLVPTPADHVSLAICLRGGLEIDTPEGPFQLSRRQLLTLPPHAGVTSAVGAGLGLLVSVPPMLLTTPSRTRGRGRVPPVFACRSPAPLDVLLQATALLRHGDGWNDDTRMLRALQVMRLALAGQTEVHAWLQRVPGRSDAHRRNTLHRLLRARHAIVNTPFEDHDLDSLALAANYSKSHFLRTFRDVFGQTPGALLTVSRIAMAKSLMSEGAMGIGEIAADVGYTSRCAFSRMFKSRVGESASNFRRRLTESAVLTPHCGS
ncbi:helix-turn-helix transcriptional regulator [Chiayiivirga flava]|uniref:AraC-like DNA-binding protein n=1 Tax=Chiayiivirga flava TaxID=659595 RepID=A0A7W8G0Q3_9GAMM|nr:AraC family transcriptional regulator [Chiayiivirga flava]MBB5206885.1 AraC-like DNA-binding protein [Chiayiivirga flava]